jgi:hypothetical protein
MTNKFLLTAMCLFAIATQTTAHAKPIYKLGVLSCELHTDSPVKSGGFLMVPADCTFRMKNYANRIYEAMVEIGPLADRDSTSVAWIVLSPTKQMPESFVGEYAFFAETDKRLSSDQQSLELLPLGDKAAQAYPSITISKRSK